jgi:phenylalanyl-tRNA synthetase beta chain
VLISYEWLNSHVDLSGHDPASVGELLTLHTAEVNGVTDPAGEWRGIHVGHVKGVRPHPDADKLRLVTVTTGEGEQEVVCGAPNIAEGQRICFAPENTVLPGGLKLIRRKIRGVESAGMVLSERELGLGENHEGILVLEPDTPIGTPIADVLGAAAAIDLDNTAITNRPDLWGHYGIARDVAAILGRQLRPMELGPELPADAPQVEVDVECQDLCPRYLGWVIGGIEVGPSPDWLRRRLEQAGQRPINNIVDLTNYIQLECGQPLHAFDRRQIAGGKIVVRRAAKQEPVTTLDGVDRKLPEGACVIADPERAVAIAGVMGLANSEVMDDTTEIILEVATFEMTSIRPTAAALGLFSDSATRFSKGLDPCNVPVAARRFFKLLRDICPAATPLGGPCDVHGDLPETRSIEYADGWVEERLGTEIAAEEKLSILKRLGFEAERASGRMTVKVPTWRLRDVAIPEDIVEEIGRIHGFDKIDPIPLVGTVDPVPLEPERKARDRLRESLSSISGFAETHLYPFITAEECERAGIEPGSLQVANAEQPGLDLMTPSLVPPMLRALASNSRHHEELALYVVAPVFAPAEKDGELPRQDERCTIGYWSAAGRESVYTLKGAIENVLMSFRMRGVRFEQGADGVPPWLHPGRAARIGRGKQTFGWFGQVHPAVARAFELDPRAAIADIDMTEIIAAQGKIAPMQPISRYPSVPYDVAVLVDALTPAGDVQAALERVDRDLVRDVRLFDVYEGKNIPDGKRSLAFTVTFGSYERTLEGKDVDRLREAVSRALVKRGWTLRE